MAGKRTNTLREYHLLVVREHDGFCWQVRYDRHANPVERSTQLYQTHGEAMTAGEAALAQHRATMNSNA